MGRPQVKEEEKEYSIMLKPSDVNNVELLLNLYRLTRSKSMEIMVQAGIKDFLKLKDPDLIVFGEPNES